MNIADWLRRAAQDAPEREALFLGAQAVASYAEFERAVSCLATGLQARGVSAGDRVALFMTNVPEYLVAQYAAWYLGAAVVPINAKLHAREAGWILENSGTALVFATPTLAQALAQALAEVEGAPQIVEVGGAHWDEMAKADPLTGPSARRPEDLAWLFYTSGTTGRPKGVQITHRMIMTMSLTYQVDCDVVHPGDAAIYAAPLSHGAGLYNVMHVRAGARHVFPVSQGFDPGEFLDLAKDLGQAHAFMAPTMVQRLTRHARAAGRKGDGLKTVVYAGGPMYTADILDAVDQLGPVFVQIYGQGECPMGITALSRADVADRSAANWRTRLGSVGKAQAAVEVCVVGTDGASLPPDSMGEILVRGDIVMPGYWQNPQASAKALKDGWLWTGDMGSMDAHGYVTLKDRSKDLIISGGTNIYPREVEDALLEHPDILEAAVIGRPHAEWGEEVVAFVVTQAEMDPASLDAHCLDRIARFKRPKAYFALTALPKNNYGKVLKTELRQKLAASS